MHTSMACSQLLRWVYTTPCSRRRCVGGGSRWQVCDVSAWWCQGRTGEQPSEAAAAAATAVVAAAAPEPQRHVPWGCRWCLTCSTARRACPLTARARHRAARPPGRPAAAHSTACAAGRWRAACAACRRGRDAGRAADWVHARAGAGGSSAPPPPPPHTHTCFMLPHCFFKAAAALSQCAMPRPAHCVLFTVCDHRLQHPPPTHMSVISTTCLMLGHRGSSSSSRGTNVMSASSTSSPARKGARAVRRRVGGCRLLRHGRACPPQGRRARGLKTHTAVSNLHTRWPVGACARRQLVN